MKYNTLCADNFNYKNRLGFSIVNFYEKAISMGEFSVGRIFLLPIILSEYFKAHLRTRGEV